LPRNIVPAKGIREVRITAAKAIIITKLIIFLLFLLFMLFLDLNSFLKILPTHGINLEGKIIS